MTRVHLPVMTLLVGILSIGGCGGSEPGSAGGGGTTGVVNGSGGAVSSGTGGVGATGGAVQVATGGTTGMGVTTASGGSEATGGTKATGGTTGGTKATGGSAVGVGGLGTGGKTTGSTGGSSTTAATGGSVATGGAIGTGGGATGGRSDGAGGTGKGGSNATGRSAAGGATGGAATGGVATGDSVATGGAVSTAPCTVTASKTASVTTSGSGTHQVVIETNSDISCGTIYRPKDLGGTEKYPIFVWGEGGCARSGTSNQASMGEIASHGYFVIADGPPSGGSCSSIGMPNAYSDLLNMAKPMLDYVSWAIAQNGKSCSAYYNSLDTTKVAADGFSCGGLMAAGTAGDSRITAWGVTSSGLTNPYQEFYKTVHTPVKILVGGSSDQANPNGARDYTNISALGNIPVIYLSQNSAGHGGDLGNGKGNFNSVNLAWLNWQLKGDTTATGKGALFGSTCKYCTDSGWVYKSANIQ
jgi:hypothetical protein